MLDYLIRMGHAPFQYPTPDGYPEEAAPWMGTMPACCRLLKKVSYEMPPDIQHCVRAESSCGDRVTSDKSLS